MDAVMKAIKFTDEKIKQAGHAVRGRYRKQPVELAGHNVGWKYTTVRQSHADAGTGSGLYHRTGDADRRRACRNPLKI
jgi:hypothetical protein